MENVEKIKKMEQDFDIEKQNIIEKMQSEIESLKNAANERTQTIMFKAEEEKRLL